MDKKIKLNLFGSLKLILDDKEIDLEEKLGKQLTSLFSLILFNRKQEISKEKLIDTLWQNSDNPISALKVSIFRLRTIIKSIDEMKDSEWIITTKKNYQFNNELDIEIDVNEFETLVFQAKNTNDATLLAKAIDIYNAPLLMNLDADWIVMERNYYKSLFIQSAENLSKHLLEENKFEEIITISKKVLNIDPYVEEMISLYVRALIQNKQYNLALNYFDSISKRFYDDMGFELQIEKKSLFNIVSSESFKKKSTNIDDFYYKILETDIKKGPLFCNFDNFKVILQFDLRNCKRERTNKHLVFISLDEVKENLASDMELLISVISASLRINDVYTKMSESQVAILLNVKEEAFAKIAIDGVKMHYGNASGGQSFSTITKSLITKKD